MYGNRPDYLFSTNDLSKIIDNQKAQIIQKVESENNEYLAKINQEEYLDFIQNEFEILPPVLLEEQIQCEVKQKKIEVVNQIRGGNIMIDGCEVRVLIPFEGESILLLSRANSWTTCPPMASIQDNKIVKTFQLKMSEVETFDDKKALEPLLKEINQYIGFLEKDLTTYNENIRSIAKNVMDSKISNYNKFNAFAKNISYPIKRETNVPATFDIPQVLRKPQISKPIVNEAKFLPEPTLSTEEYDHILKICSDMSLVIERNPNAFFDMEEEVLRTHFLVQLNGHYQGQATGETFNSIGKTDILIRDDNKNVFIAECKFWKGEKVYLSTIDQLLGYVTYRDTKTSILIFDKNKDFSNTLTKIQESTPTHSNFVRQDKTYKSPIESAYRYVFKNKNDEDKEFLLTVIAFHIPQKT